MSQGLAAGAVTVLVAISCSALAETRPAQCLLEVDGVHYLGGACSFIALDKLGSFRITDAQGLFLIAQVNASKKDEGRAVWNGPLGGSAPAKDLGEAYRTGGCWTASVPNQKGADSLICAWSMDEKVYVGPSPKTPRSFDVLYVGSRVGMYDDIVSREGLDTANAVVLTKPSREGAVTFCREYSRDYSIKCINEQMRGPQQRVVRGNCRERSFSDFDGNRYQFLGPVPKRNTDVMAEYAIRDMSTRELLDGSSASGYDVRLGIFQTLCPSSAPKRQD